MGILNSSTCPTGLQFVTPGLSYYESCRFSFRRLRLLKHCLIVIRVTIIIPANNLSYNSCMVLSPGVDDPPVIILIASYLITCKRVCLFLLCHASTVAMKHSSLGEVDVKELSRTVKLSGHPTSARYMEVSSKKAPVLLKQLA